MLRQVLRFLEQHGDGRFSLWHRSDDDHAPKTLHRAGVRRLLGANGVPIGKRQTPQYAHEITSREDESVEFFVLAETFKGEVCQGYDPESVARALHERGCLQTKEPGRFSVSMRLPGGIGKARCYHVTAAIFDLDL